MPIHRLGYLVFDSPEVAAWPTFATEILGAMTYETDHGSVRVRFDEMPWRVEVQPADTARLVAAGWEVRDGADLERVAEQLAAAGHTVDEAPPDEAEQRGVEQLVRVSDPCDNPLELYHSPVVTDDELHLTGVSGYVMGDLGLGHVVIPAPDLDACFDFYTRLLGFRHRDTMRITRPDTGATTRMRFLGCNPRHHSLALAETAEPTGIRHLMLEMALVRDVGRAYDRTRRQPERLRTHLGQHSNDEMFSYYLYTPEQFAIEVGTGGLHVNDATWSARELRHLSYWGYEFVGTR